ncbi:MAG: sugar transferase [Parasphingorhabdus sp.]
MRPAKLKLVENRHDPLGSIDYSDQASFHGQSLLDKFRVQLPLIIITAIAAQIIFHYFFLGGYTFFQSQTSLNSIVVTTLANVAGLLSYKRLRLFPGSRRMAFLIPAFGSSYIVLLIAILIARIPYSNQQLFVGFATAIFLAWMFNVVARRPSAAPLMVVRSERTEAMISELPQLSYQFCERPIDIIGAQNGIVVDLRRDVPAEWEQAITKATLAGTTIYHVKHIQESLTGRVQIDHLSENSFGSLAPDSLYFALKNIVDRISASFLLLVSLPILLIAAIAIKLDSPGPAIFKQRRIGYRGNPFIAYKLRTMINSDQNGKDRQSSITLDNDPRITKLGRFLRKTRIDELPQLVNVILGEMSLIGPRPEAEKLSEWYAESIDFYAYRHVVLPGITGWAQVKQGHVADTDEVYHKLQYDFYYIKHFSMWLDIMITFKTVATIFNSKGAK